MNRCTVIAAMAAVLGVFSLGVLTAKPAIAQAGIKPPSDVRVINVPSVNISSMPSVLIVNDRVPVRHGFTVRYNANAAVANIVPEERFQVPEGKVLVIEMLSLNAPESSHTANIFDYSGAIDADIAAYMAVPPLNANGRRVGEKLISIRIPSGHELGGSFPRVPNANEEVLFGTFQGYLEPASPFVN
jgi:hypothetical protein